MPSEFFATVARELEVACDLPECGSARHGHRLRVEVTATGRYDAQTGNSLEVKDLESSIDITLREVAGKPLDVISPGRPTPHGFGLWLIERLLREWPKVIEVKVWRDPQTCFSIRREPL